MKTLFSQTCLLLTSVFAAGCTNLSESRFWVPKDAEPDMKPVTVMEEPDSRPDMREEEDMRPELDMRDDGKCTRVSDCKTDLPNVVASCDSNGRCNYQCVMDEEQTWAVIQNQVIDVNGCNCEVLPESCNGQDEDCDGVPDNDLALECQMQDGVCAGALNYCNGDSDSFNSSCSNETYREHAANNGFFFSDNIHESHRCDGLDNNCDGRVDEACCPQTGSKQMLLQLANSNETPFKILSAPQIPNGFTILSIEQDEIHKQTIYQLPNKEGPIAFDTNYERDEGTLITIVNNVFGIDSDFQQLQNLRDGTAQLNNHKIYQAFASARNELYHVASYDPDNPEASHDHQGHQFIWMPLFSLSGRPSRSSAPLLAASGDRAFFGGWVDAGEPNAEDNDYEFRSCIGGALEQDCATNSFTYNDAFGEPPLTAVAGLENGARFILVMHISESLYRYVVYNASTRQAEITRDVHLPNPANEYREVSTLKIKWLSSTRVLLAQHVWYPDRKLNQLDLHLIDTASPAESQIMAQATLTLEEALTKSSVELVMTQTLEDHTVLLWSQDSKGVNTSLIKVTDNNTLTTSTPHHFFPFAETNHRTLIDAAFNGRHLGILLTEALGSSPETKTTHVFFASPEGSPLCYLPPSPTD